MNLFTIRKEYRQKLLNERNVDPDPLIQLINWLEDAKLAGCLEYSAMSVATTNSEGQPSIRTVLLKEVKPDGLLFFTNYKSKKGKELSINPHIAAHFFWPELERQVRIGGIASKTTAEISDGYFRTRPFESQISALVSTQSMEIPNRAYLEKCWEAAHEKLKNKPIERPDFWGGYIIKPIRVEFWQGRPHRLHDRIFYKKTIDGWKISRLAP
ncbi:MAG TPA: pyridoxamine 5'-phosphate oxidase [Prolixibacteraceae bacterium]|nr:pyridoxamine 5'-phosphate oxidase [Prolixibacteraceae bacterium]